MQEQLDNVSKVGNSKDWKEMLETKNSVTEMKNDFDKNIWTWAYIKRNLPNWKAMRTKAEKRKQNKQTNKKDRREYPRTVGQLQKM